MDIGFIKGCTRIVGSRQGYNGLPLRDSLIDDPVTGPDTPMMESLWRPSAEDIVKMMAGKPLKLSVLGNVHPPVMLSVADDSDISRIS